MRERDADADDRRQRVHLQPHVAGRRAAGRPAPAAPSDIEKVTVDYTWDIMTPLMRPFFTGGQIHLKVDSAMKNEARFQ